MFPRKESLEGQLCSAMSMSNMELRAMGLRGRSWMQEDYDWDSIAKKLVDCYRWVLFGGERPDSILL